ncbi:uncharacterized protein LOC111100644 isoform X2 [Crassostrea virginica]
MNDEEKKKILEKPIQYKTQTIKKYRLNLRGKNDPLYNFTSRSKEKNIESFQSTSSRKPRSSGRPQCALTNLEDVDFPSTSTCSQTQLEETFFSEVELYFQDLTFTKGITLFPGNDRILVIKDYQISKKKTHNEKYVLLERRSFKFKDGDCRWIYWCQCNENRARAISSLDHHLIRAYTEFSSLDKECIHVEVAKKIFDRYDSVHDIEPPSEADRGTCDDHGYSLGGNILYEVPDAKLICCGGVTCQRFGLVTFEKRSVSCLSCCYRNCLHVSTMKEVIANKEETLYHELIEKFTSGVPSETPETTKSVYKQKLISQKRIPFFRCDELSDMLKNLQLNEFGPLLPEDVICKHCSGNLVDGDPVQNNWIAYDCALIVTNNTMQYVKSYYRPCTVCDSVSLFEGQSKGLLNMGTYLVGYDVLRSYMHSFLHGKRPLYTFYQCWCDVHLDLGNTQIQEFSYQRLRIAWHCFLSLLDIDNSQGFSCPHCGGDETPPQTIVCDGTSLSFQRRMWDWKENAGTDNVLHLSSSKYSERTFIPDGALRKLLNRYSGDGRVVRGVKNPSLTEKEKGCLLKGVKELSPALHSILLSIEEDRHVFKHFQRLLMCLSSPSPVCSLIRPTQEVGQLIESISRGENLRQDPVKLDLLHKKMPIIFEVIESGAEVRDLGNLLSELWEIAVDPFVCAREDTSLEENVDVEDLSFFPTLHKYRNRGIFEMDLKNMKKKQGTECCKRFAGHPSLLPGIFTIFCPHGICYGFQVMESHESPNVPFTILRTRFKKAPKHIIYDNACKLQQYCLSRDPLFFKTSEFYVDRLHWDNHTACSLAYDLSIYPQFSALNSQCNEQANAGLKRIKEQLSYMTANNFMMHCTFFLWNKNLLKLSSI